MKISTDYVERFFEFTTGTERSFTEKIDFLLKMNAHHFMRDSKINPIDYFDLISGLSEACSSTALSFSMHLYTQWGMCRILSNERFAQIFNQSDQNKLFGSFNEPGIYFVREDQLLPEHFSIHAKKTDDGYLISGVKKFVSLEPYVYFLPVYCYVENPTNEEGRIAVMLIRRSAKGITTQSDWDTISMSESNSNSIYLDSVLVPHLDVLYQNKDALQKTNDFAYLFRLSVVSVYYGIANKAYQFVVNYCKEKQVSHTNRSLSFFPGVQFSIAEMSILLEVSRSQIVRYCSLLQDHLVGTPTPENINIISIITKETVVKNAEQVVNLAMKVVGISSISNSSILSKLYQDVKAGLFHPPQSDVTYEMIAKHRLGVLTHRTRWL
ncbi:acyl-CoA dehydrogenase family protein [Paenibacillus sp. ClWae2A]|uniref:acyl-CoA dehydrogenase family protein n=1 Tax=Paenibacillus sp. ClWae2A TaxID=3057177 RepID=UPI0028F6AE0D|nr:acyl-CoA dehydrogenase family protein [Paenibacillus sp. ClWae2A]MDT9722456.1 acyl-CoA dehydrogenase family protein [Paenibacillus sp. ClWae2A]